MRLIVSRPVALAAVDITVEADVEAVGAEEVVVAAAVEEGDKF